jgi:Fur family peroxide stress response transcriptional regulator
LIRPRSIVDEKVRELESHLRREGLSVTHQRLAVYRCLLEDDSHPDAERVFERVRRRVPTISLGTVYKALDMLKDLGAVAEVDAPRSATRYEAVIEPHHHLICESCGRILDLHAPEYSALRPEAPVEGFEVKACSVQFHGLCRACARRVKKRTTGPGA